MKLSRRGKRVIRTRRGRRYTKRAGKHLRYRGKKVRVSKRYSRVTGRRGRGRGHTKKNLQNIYGRRFMKGGVLCDGVEYKWVWVTSEDGQNFTCTIDAKDVKLFYKKKGPYPTRDSMFSVNISLAKNFKDCKSWNSTHNSKENLTIQFARQPSTDNVNYSFTDLDYFTGNNLKIWKLESNSKTTYDFSDSKNTEILKCISDFIKNKIKDVYQNIVSLLTNNCKMNTDYGLLECTDSAQLFGKPDVYTLTAEIKSAKELIKASEKNLENPRFSEEDKAKMRSQIANWKSIIQNSDTVYTYTGDNMTTRARSVVASKNIQLLIKIGNYIVYLLGIDTPDVTNLTNLTKAKNIFIRIIDDTTDGYFYTPEGMDYEIFINEQPRAAATDADAAATVVSAATDVPAPADIFFTDNEE